VRILLAEDSSTVRALVAARLVADGYEVIEAADGEQALALARSERPDLIVLDKVMPKLDGFEVVRLLRERDETRTLPIVMLTERSNEDDVLGGLDLGVDEYMPKPFSPHELSRRVRRALERPAAEDERRGRRRRDRPRRRRRAELRPGSERTLAVYLASGEGASPPAVASGGLARAVFRKVALDALAELRGRERQRLTDLLESSGIVEQVVHGLASRTRRSRRAAADALGVIRSAQAEQALERGLADRDVLVRLACARALAELGHVPACNEAAGIVDSVRSLLALPHPSLEVVVVNDGSSDQTPERLTAAFHLRRVERPTPPFLAHKPVLAAFVPRDRLNLLVFALGENLGYRQLSHLWKLEGFWQLVRKGEWGAMERKGLARTELAPEVGLR